MKKLLSLLLCAVLGLGALTGLACCKKESGEPELDTQNAFIENFDNIDHNYWSIMNTRWGGTAHGGVIRENIGYTADGSLMITANGDYYNGDKRDVDGVVGKRTGGAITTHNTFGPGVFSARIKALPRFGATTAFWTFFNDGVTKNDSGLIYNSEIDFELNVDSFDTTMCTNWTAEKTGNFDNHNIITDVYHNDGNWHEYTFKWSTNPKKIEYYVDNVLIHTSLSNVPTYAANVNFGVWFAQFAGTSDFETDHCYVDWFKYTPYKNQPYNETPCSAPPISNAGYPTSPTPVPEKVNLIGDAGFENPYYAKETDNAWYMYPGDAQGKRTLNDAKVANIGRNNSTGLELQAFDRVTQTYTQVWGGYTMDFSGYVKHAANQSGTLTVQYLPNTEEILGSEELVINSSTEGFTANEFYKIFKRIVVPQQINGKKITRMRLRFSADDKPNNKIIIDDLFMNHIIIL